MSYYKPSTYSQYGNLTINAATTSASGYVYTTSGTGTTAVNANGWANPVTITQSAKIELKGEDADIILNGQSLNESLKEIKDALRIPSRLHRDTSLEKDWEELQSAADHYTKLLKEYRDKQKVWDTLKTQD
jgi:hypothetical protein